ncbi:magnesium transporter CorA family protein [Listeria fleischmannii]|uniref:magnesium transporter CorA family protein n=1 Tax=Listeria fleischmannii TaxID=1069827 RepID=UPI0016254792|nr:magnesium transporter CorA family protein [Listeria fleischmannii]MBC1420073.1 magnesium transporter CorA family protein [Listeria fleischmannii]
MLVKELGNNYKWLVIHAEAQNDFERLRENYAINNEILEYSLDKHEKAHVEYDQTEEVFYLIYNAPLKMEKADYYQTVPFTLIIKDDYLITIHNQKTAYIIEILEKCRVSNPNLSLYQFLFKSIFLITEEFFPAVELMEDRREEINQKLKAKTTKKSLLELSDLETSITYMVSASKQNSIVLEQTKLQSIYRSFKEYEKEQLEDAIIEARQLVEMTHLSSQILQQLSGTYNNVLNNNLNDTMKILTVLSVLLTLPTMVAGFFGMNMPLPLEHNAYGWIISIIISLVLWLVLSLILRKILR